MKENKVIKQLFIQNLFSLTIRIKSWYNVGVEWPVFFFFTPQPKDPQTFSRNFHLSRNKLGISMLFLPDFSIILIILRVSKYEKFLNII